MNNTETIEEMSKMTDLLREQLTRENEKYYSDLLIYIRTA
ncbi:hypothetical protein SAMN04489868_101146 [Pisciglobus halotolerans]|uniref:Uncharacterized protein n=1 Tax=Pisciglobus halotolerans TaxID=745365 RepID=A0A1I3ART7_9LACT|nr:hypothetical protein SAMN04489868_101146 [Pisciglobus halotolerans]